MVSKAHSIDSRVTNTIATVLLTLLTFNTSQTLKPGQLPRNLLIQNLPHREWFDLATLFSTEAVDLIQGLAGEIESDEVT